jgi:hypothetical protein
MQKLQKIVLLLALLVYVQTAANAVDITISTFSTGPIYQAADDVVVLRLYYSDTFVDSTGTVIVGGAVGSSNFYKSLPCSLNTSTKVATCTSFTMPSTTDSSKPNVTLTGVFYGGKSASTLAQRSILFSNWKVPTIPTTRTYQDLNTYNNAQRPTNPDTYYTAAQVDSKLNNLSTAPDATDAIKGKVKLSTPAASLSNPIAVGKNDLASTTNAGLVTTTTASSTVVSTDDPRVTGGGGVQCSGVDDTTALNAAFTAGGTVRITRGTSCAASSSVTFLSTATLQIDNGGLLKPVGTQTITISSPIDAGAWPIFTNALAGQGTIAITSYGTQEIYPEWFGAVPGSGANQTTNKKALQAAMNAAGTGRAISNSNYLYNRILKFSGLYYVNGTLVGNHTMGFNWEGQNMLSSGLVQTAANTKLLDANAIAYGTFTHMQFATTASQDRGLVDIYNDKSAAEFQNDLSPQNIRFRYCVIAGANVGYIGVWIARTGGGSQGDNVSFEDTYINGFTEAGAQLGGGHNTDYAYNAINVHFTRGDIQGCPKFGLAAYGGNWIVEGTTMENQTFVNGIITQTGVDVNCEGAQRPCEMRNVTSESLNIAAGVSILEHITQQLRIQAYYSINGGSTLAGTGAYVGEYMTGTFVGGDGKPYKVTSVSTDTKSAYAPITVPFTTPPTVGNTQIVTDSTGAYVVNSKVDHYMQIRFPNCYGAGDASSLPTSAAVVIARIAANTATEFTLEYPGTVFTPGDASGACGNHTEYAIFDHAGYPYPLLGGLSLTTATSGSSTTIVKAGAGWTINAFATDYRVSIISGTGKYQYAPIVSNTADTITHGGWVTDYDKIAVVAPDSTSQFVVEPNWNGGTVTLTNGAGSVTLEAQSFNTIGPDYYTALAVPGTVQQVVANDVTLQFGGRADIEGAFENITVNRQDWALSNVKNALDGGRLRSRNVHVYRIDGDRPLPWVNAGNTLTREPVVSQAEFGDDTLRFSSGDSFGSFADVGISRGDGLSYTGTTDEKISRNILAFEGMLGCKTPFGTNQNGQPCRVQGGLATGSGTPGNFEIWGGPTPGASGTTVRAGSRLAYFNYQGFFSTAKQFIPNAAAPSTPASGTTVTWTDATDKNLKAKDDAGRVTVTVAPNAGASNQFLTAIGSDGAASKAQPAFSNLLGALAQTQVPTGGSAGQVLSTNGSGTGNYISLSGIAGAPLATQLYTVSEALLSTTTAVDMNTATPTTLYTCPSGKNCVITRVIVSNASTSLTTASYSFGWTSAAYADVIVDATHTELTGATLYTVLVPKAGALLGTSTGTFKVLMNTLQGGAATARIDVLGFVY